MATRQFCNFLSCFRHATLTKWVRFSVWSNVKTYELIKLLIADGFLKSFLKKGNRFVVSTIPIWKALNLNSIILYSTVKWNYKIKYKNLIDLTRTGGYFILSTNKGLINDSDAWRLWAGGILVAGIF